MIDSHCHVLFGVDDGAKTIEASMEMLRIAHDDGIKKVICTSHCLPGIKFENSYDSLKIVFDQLVNEVKAQHLDLELYLACELMASPASLEWLKEHKVATYNQTNWILSEIPFLKDVQFEVDEGVYFRTVMAMGYRLIIAHPERYALIQDNYAKLAEWRALGCKFMVNRTSLIYPERETEYNLAWKIVEDGYCDVVASDAHRVVGRVNKLSDAYALVAERYGVAKAETMFCENPQRLLDGLDLL